MSLPFQRPPKMPSMIPPRFLHLRGSQQGMVWLTKMVSSPMTSISFHPITISSSWPISPMHLGRPWMTMATSWAVQVSTSTSSTQPRRVPSQTLMTSLLCMSVILQSIHVPPLVSYYSICGGQAVHAFLMEASCQSGAGVV